MSMGCITKLIFISKINKNTADPILGNLEARNIASLASFLCASNPKTPSVDMDKHLGRDIAGDTERWL